MPYLMKVLIDKTVGFFNRNVYATFISTVFENVYMVKLVRVPGSGLAFGPGRVQGRNIRFLVNACVIRGVLWILRAYHRYKPPWIYLSVIRIS